MKISKFRADWLPILGIGLLIQLFWAWRLIHPSYMDAYYYTINGARLADGFGFTVPVIWQYLDGLQALPAPSHTYWMPLPSILAMGGYLLGDSFRWAQIPFFLLAGGLPWLSFIISSYLVGERWQAWAAAIFTAAGGYYAAYLSQPTSFAPFAWAGGTAILLMSLSLCRHKKGYWAFAGIAAGLAHLTRADGILLLLVGLIVWGWDLLLAIRNKEKSAQWSGLFLLLAGYALIMAPWFWRNINVMGEPMSSAGAQTMFLTTYDDIFSYGRTFTLSDYVAWGWRNIISSKWDALWLTIQTFIAVSGLIFLSPLAVWAWVRLSRQAGGGDKMRPLTLFAIGLVLVLALVFTFPAGRGSVLHSSAAIWAWMMPLAVAGLDIAVDWIAQRRRHWQPEQAKRIFVVAFGLIIFGLTPIVAGNQPLRREEGRMMEQIGAQLPPDAVVMTGNPPMFYYHTNIAGITLPNERFEVIAEMNDKFGVTHLLLDMDHPKKVNPIWQNEEIPPQLEWVADFYAESDIYLARCRELYGADTPEESCPVFRLFAVQ